MKTIEANAIITEAYALAIQAAPARPSGCGRVYIMPSTKEARSAVRRAAGSIGKRWLRGALYFGYDNATGKELAQGEAFAKALNERGIPCYMDAEGD